MFSLIRRISYGVIPRPDRPWEDDPTSNAPRTRRKRRLSSTERDQEVEEELARKKKARGDSATPPADEALATPLPQAETQEVKEVTQGVQEVDLKETSAEEAEAPAAPESVPLPEETSGELDEPFSDVTPPPESQGAIVDGPTNPAGVESTDTSAPIDASEAVPEKGMEEVLEEVLPSDGVEVEKPTSSIVTGETIINGEEETIKK